MVYYEDSWISMVKHPSLFWSCISFYPFWRCSISLFAILLDTGYKKHFWSITSTIASILTIEYLIWHQFTLLFLFLFILKLSLINRLWTGKILLEETIQKKYYLVYFQSDLHSFLSVFPPMPSFGYKIPALAFFFGSIQTEHFCIYRCFQLFTHHPISRFHTLKRKHSEE